jgi:serine/threonine protein phosphatase PrpC
MELAGQESEGGDEDAENAASVACPHCGEMTLRGGKFCEHCGQELPSDVASTAVVAVEVSDSVGHTDASATLVLRPDDLKKVQGVPQPIVSHVVAFRTDIGHKHHVNQDAGGAWTWTRPDGLSASLTIVADGVSAGRSSEGASKLVVDVLEKRLSPLMADPQKNIDALVSALLETAREANIEVAQRPHHSISSADATTLVAALCVGEEGGGVWCGDSRVYHVSGQHLTRLTRDHSWAEGVVSHGIMSAEDAARDPRAHMITRWLGPPAKEDPGIETFRFTLSPGDIVMCCTDGLYMYFAPPASAEIEMAQTLASYAGNLQGGIDHLVEVALQRGGRDNVTAAAISRDAVPSEATEHTTELPVLKKQAEVETMRLRPRSKSKKPVT